MILLPPEAPKTSRTWFELSTTITGDMDERGRFVGAMKFASLGSNPNEFGKPGVLKSSIVSEYIIPVCSPIYFAPKLL